MKILIKNCTLVSMAEGRPQYEENMDVLIENDTISKIDKNISEEQIDKVIEADENVIMPGLINCHCHVPMSIFRETVDGYDLQDWLNKKIWPIEANLTEEDVYKASKISFEEMIKTGTTTVNDMYFMEDEIIKAAKESGIRLQTTDTLYEIKGKEYGQFCIKDVERLLQEYKEEELISINAGLHSFYSSSKEYVIQCVQFAKSNNIPLHVHFCENSNEVEDIKKIYDKMPVDILEDIKQTKIILAHCVKLSEQDIERISKIDSDISIATCPVSNLKLGCGVANINKMKEVGLNVCIGTDGQGSGCSLDMFEQMKFVALLQKGFYEKPELMPAYDVLKMATINGANALGLDSKIGSIEAGKKADVILIDMKSILTTPINNLLAELVYNVKGTNVKMTMVNGRILLN